MLIYELGTHVIGRIADSPKFIKLSCFGKIIKNYNAHQCYSSHKSKNSNSNSYHFKEEHIDSHIFIC